MAGLSDYCENKVLDLLLNGVAFAAPAAQYVTLHTVDPTDAGTDAGITRVSGSFALSASGALSNDAAISFLAVPAGTYTYASVWDSLAGGNMLLSAPLLASKTADAGDNITFAIGDLDVTAT